MSSSIIEKIAKAIKETGEGKYRSRYCSASEIFGPMTFSDLLDGAKFPQSEGIYIIWGESGQDRPLYVGMTTKGQDRPLYHLRTPHHSPIGDILKDSKPDCFDWAIFFCPLVGDLDSRVSWLLCTLLSFERKIVYSLHPWFWHGGLQGDPLDCPYIKANL